VTATIRNPFRFAARAKAARNRRRAGVLKRKLNAEHRASLSGYLPEDRVIKPAKARPLAVADAAEVERLRQFIDSRLGASPKMPATDRQHLIDELVNAALAATAGRPGAARKGRKPKAWVYDVLVKDVCDALRSVGVRPTMDSNRALSHAQYLAGEISQAISLPGQGQLFKQMQRARRIIKEGG
jgi:DNA-directed RNA polymerase specialized sigma24 family protein